MNAVCTRILIQIIFPVKNRKNMIPLQNLDEVFECIAGIIRNKEQNPIVVGGTSTHIHALVELTPEIVFSTLIREIKNESAKFINQKKWLADKFSWHNDSGIFSYSFSQVEKVCDYIRNQSVYHKTMTFREEFVAYLNKFDVEYNENELPSDFEKGLVAKV